MFLAKKGFHELPLYQLLFTPKALPSHSPSFLLQSLTHLHVLAGGRRAVQMRASASPLGTGHHTYSRFKMQNLPQQKACLLKSLSLLLAETPESYCPCVSLVSPSMLGQVLHPCAQSAACRAA